MATESVDDPNKMREMAEQFAKDFNIDRQKYSRLSVRKSHVTFRTDHNYNGSGGWSEGEPGISVPNWIVGGHAYYTRECARKVLEGQIDVISDAILECYDHDNPMDIAEEFKETRRHMESELRAAIEEVGEEK